MASIPKPVPSGAIASRAVPSKAIRAKITSKGQITIPAEIRRSLGAGPGDVLVFEPTSNGIRLVRQVDEDRFERMRGIGVGIPEMDESIDGIVRYFREMRGHDEVDDRIFGTDRR